VPLQVIVLHSLVPKEQMEAVMAEAIPGHCKVVLSTNMAESSITITDVRYIIDTGLHRDIVFDDRRGMPSLLCSWCAQASVKQRAGRAGRVAPGTVLHLFTRQFHDQFMSPFDTAEILRVPLEKTVLNVKMLLSRFGRATELIQQTITPPPRDRVSAAVKQLFEVGALSANSEDSDVTVGFPFNYLRLALPEAVPIQLLSGPSHVRSRYARCALLVACMGASPLFFKAFSLLVIRFQNPRL
jgi:HrpA-like RNA helicase